MHENFMKTRKRRPCADGSFSNITASGGLSGIVAFVFSLFAMQSVSAQTTAGATSKPDSTAAPHAVNTQIAHAATQIAQTAPPQFLPTDVTPFTLSPNRNNFNPAYKFRLFQNLPERLWLDTSAEVSQRLDTNVFLTHGHYKGDYVFRVAPNVSVGYNVLKNTSVYANYFMIKDFFAYNTSLTFPTNQSLSIGVNHNHQFGDKTTLQLDFQAREIWQASHLHQFDFIPGATLTHVVTPNNIVFVSALLQLRGKDYMVAPTREIDPFYTVGYICRRGAWTFIANDTLITNFRHPPFNDAIPPQSNVNMIADFEVNRPVVKQVPALVAFARAEPVWNWKGMKAPGLSGFDFRLYGGLRISASKPSYYSTIDNLRNEIMKSEGQENQSK
jgi:hypothetical protein